MPKKDDKYVSRQERYEQSLTELAERYPRMKEIQKQNPGKDIYQDVIRDYSYSRGESHNPYRIRDEELKEYMDERRRLKHAYETENYFHARDRYANDERKKGTFGFRPGEIRGRPTLHQTLAEFPKADASMPEKEGWLSRQRAEMEFSNERRLEEEAQRRRDIIERARALFGK